MDTTFNTNLRRIRKECGITQEQLADAVGVSAQAVSKWEISSFPDAQLLPAIADKLGVTIDELYGRACEDKSIYQRVLDHVNGTDDSKKFEEIVKICYAFGEAFCGCPNYERIPEHTLKAQTWSNYSQFIGETGVLQMRNNANLHYFLLLPEPEKGYDDVLKYDEETVRLFRFLSMPNALRAVYYFMSHNDITFFRRGTLVTVLGITEKNAQEIIDELTHFDFVYKASLDDGTKKEAMYSFQHSELFLQLFTFAWVMLHIPTGFSYQNTSRSRGFFKNDTYKKKEKGKENEEEKAK